MESLMKTKHILFTSLAAALAITIVGCGQGSSPTPDSSSPAASAENLIPQELVASDQLEGAIGVVDARKDVQEGKEAVVTGFIGGRAEPFVEGRAIFTLADSKAIIRCDVDDDDHCATPWDACCDDPAKIKASIATVQIVDGDGMVLKQTLKDFQGIKPGSTVSVKGTIAPGSTKDALVINADQIHVASK